MYLNIQKVILYLCKNKNTSVTKKNLKQFMSSINTINKLIHLYNLTEYYLNII